jgi:hypothetical protein
VLIVARLVLRRCQVADRLEQPAVIEPIDPVERREFDGFDTRHDRFSQFRGQVFVQEPVRINRRLGTVFFDNSSLQDHDRVLTVE